MPAGAAAAGRIEVEDEDEDEDGGGASMRLSDEKRLSSGPARKSDS